jgi:hypothetical protein
MEKPRKSGRTRAAAVTAGVLAAAAFASLAATGYAARLVPFSHASPTAKQYPAGKVTICHHTHSAKNPFVTITVSANAVPAHLKHGDTLGACSAAPPAAGVVAGAKVHKAHKAKHANKGQLHRHFKASKPAKTHGKANGKSKPKTHGSHAQAPTTSSPAHGKGHENTHGQAKTHGQGSTHSSGKGQGADHAKTHGNGGGQGHGNGQSQGAATTTHGNSGGNGKGHKK